MQVEARLRAFAAVARCGSLSKAADELYVSQPAVSKHLASLERQLGHRLVTRGREGATLTATGEVLADYVLRAEALLANAGRALAAGAEETGTLAISASGIPGTYLLPSLLATFRERHPAVELAFEETTSAGALESVRAHRAELAVVGGFSAPPELESEPLVEDEVVLIGPPSLGGRRLRPRDLEGLTWITREEGSSTRAAVETARWEMGLHSVPILALPSWEAVKLSVSRGVGIAAISRLALELELEARRVAILDVPRWRLQRTISVVRPRDVPLTPPAERFLELLLETFVTHRPPPNSNLPAFETALVGRDRELAELTALVQAGRLVTLTGAGGSGKTRLAIEVAGHLVDDFPDGVYLVDLSPLRDPELVLSAIADVLAVKDAELEPRLQRQRLLLVLDNFEHLLAATSPVVRLASTAPGVAVLVTSRVQLRVRGERKYRVEPLALDDAASLLVTRARDVNPRFGDGAPVRRICERLDRLPLAIQLVAARARGTTAARLADRLEARLPALAGRRDAPARQRTLNATIAWSYDLLDESQQELLAGLAVFRGGWSSEAAEAVCGADEADVLALTDANLIRADGSRRFSMLETVRDFAHDRLVESSGLDDLRRRHAAYMISFAESSRPLARGPDEHAVLAGLALELDNFRAAFAFALEKRDPALGLTLGEALEPLWIRGMRQREAVRWLEPLLRLEGDVDLAVRAGSFTVAGRSAIEAGDVEEAEPWLRQGLELARASGDDRRTAWAAHGVGHLLAEQGHVREAKDLFEESLQLFLRLGEHAPAGGRMTYLAYYAAREGDLELARSLIEQAAKQYRLAGDTAGVGGCLNSLGDLALEQGDLATALRHYREAQPTLIASGTPLDLVTILGGMAALAAQSGRRKQAGRLWGALERIDADSDRKLEADDRARYERAIGDLDPADVDAGRTLSNEQAVALARQTSDELAA